MEKQKFCVSVNIAARIFFVMGILIECCVSLLIFWTYKRMSGPYEFLVCIYICLGTVAFLTGMALIFAIKDMLFFVKVEGTNLRIRNGFRPAYTASVAELESVRCYTRKIRGTVYYYMAFRFRGRETVEVKKGMTNFKKLAGYLYELNEVGELLPGAIREETKAKLFEYSVGDFGLFATKHDERVLNGPKALKNGPCSIELLVSELQDKATLVRFIPLLIWFGIELLSCFLCMYLPGDYFCFTFLFMFISTIAVVPVIVFTVKIIKKMKKKKPYEITADFAMEEYVLYMNGEKVEIDFGIFSECFRIQTGPMKGYVVDKQYTELFKNFMKENGIPHTDYRDA